MRRRLDHIDMHSAQPPSLHGEQQRATAEKKKPRRGEERLGRAAHYERRDDTGKVEQPHDERLVKPYEFSHRTGTFSD
jgi:hypothetical protein